MSRPGGPGMQAPARARRLGQGLAAGCAAGSVAAIVALASCGSPSSGTVASAPATAGARAAAAAGAAALQQAFVTVISRVRPSVVEIRTATGLGSGVVLDGAGDIVTNAHVVGSASTFQVLSAASARAVRAVLVGVCRGDDLAVIKVGADAGLRPATFGTSAGVAVGDIVLAIGSPLGLGGSVTEGIVSAVRESVAEPAEPGSPAATLPGAIQTSAAINPGNSGGALVAIDGKVVGIPTLAAVNRSAGGPAQGIGFAIPARAAVRVGRWLVANGAATGEGGNVSAQPAGLPGCG
ncbi:MAG TPA: trypsin-like peptidase domain-containing protein [Streptosporangiaceae bacterium]|nr:trypsin-like peptidase domain-containing protein [Streptosporangiaceae bacterium]